MTRERIDYLTCITFYQQVFRICKAFVGALEKTDDLKIKESPSADETIDFMTCNFKLVMGEPRWKALSSNNPAFSHASFPSIKNYARDFGK